MAEVVIYRPNLPGMDDSEFVGIWHKYHIPETELNWRKLNEIEKALGEIKEHDSPPVPDDWMEKAAAG